MMIKMNKKFWKKLSVSLLVGMGVIAAASSASADTGGGIGGGGSNGNLRGNVHWTSIAYNEKGKAYEKFLELENLTGRDKTWVNDQVKSRVHSSTVCQNSKVVWYLEHDRTGRWVYNYSLETHGSSWNNHSTNNRKSSIEKPSDTLGTRNITQGEISAFKNWDKTSNGNLIDKKPGYVIICSGRFDQQVEKPPIVTSWPEQQLDSSSVSYTYNEPHTYSTNVTAQLNKNGVDPIGQNNLQSQAKNDRTNYGAVIDGLKTGSVKGSLSSVKSKIDSAVAKDKSSAKDYTIDLNAKNKAGMAEGGILNFDQRALYSKVTLTREDSISLDRTCTRTQTWNASQGKYNTPTTKCTNWKKTVTNGTPQLTKNGTTQKNIAFWQMLSVHCNPEEFSALTKSGNGITAISQGNVATKVAAAAKTKVYTARPSKLDFGDTQNTNAARKATANLGFYDKECPFDCTPSSSTSDGASKNNGATTNVVKSGKTVSGGKHGATSGDINNNSFDFFRDNDPKNVKVDVWYPAKVAGVDYKGTAPTTTTVTRWAEGTPGISGSDGGKFVMKSANGDQLFTGKSGEPANQKNWSTDTFNTANSTSLKGLHNQFTVQASWASEKNKPQQLNVKYEYAPNVSTTFFSKGIGFTKKANSYSISQKTGSTETVATPIEGKCYVNYGDGSVDTTKAFKENTGTGTKNNLDKGLFEGPGTNKKTNLIVKFVRATAE